MIINNELVQVVKDLVSLSMWSEIQFMAMRMEKIRLGWENPIYVPHRFPNED
jgi:hypothetical protein